MITCGRVTEKEGTAGLKSQALGWHRGLYAGIIDAIITLQNLGHTKIAEKLQKYYEMDENGTISSN